MADQPTKSPTGVVIFHQKPKENDPSVVERPWGIYLDDKNYELLMRIVMDSFDRINGEAKPDNYDWSDWRGIKDLQAKMMRVHYDNTFRRPV